MRIRCCLLFLLSLQSCSDAFLIFRTNASPLPTATSRTLLTTPDWSLHADDGAENDPSSMGDVPNTNTTRVEAPKPKDLTIIDNSQQVNKTASEKMAERPMTTPKRASESDNLSFITSVGATTNRGEFATKTQKMAVAKVVQELEQYDNACSDATGTWELVYTNTQLFRGSPFFLAGRATCQTQEEREKYDWFCEMHRQALAISQIQAVRQIITKTSITNEFEVSVGSIPFLNDFTPFSYSGGLPVTITGAIVSTASLSSLSKEGVPMIWELFMDTVEIKGSNIPLLRQVLDLPQLQLPTRRLSTILKENISSYRTPKPILQTTYLTDRFRITRDQDDNTYVYVRTSPSAAATDYSSKVSDLGLTRLLEGFNDAVTKLYL